jgi:hypothetical protein
VFVIEATISNPSDIVETLCIFDNRCICRMGRWNY